MKEQRIVRPSPIDQPSHSSDHILPRRDLSRIPSVIGEEDDVLLFIPEMIAQELHHVVCVVDASSERLRGPDVVDPADEGLALAVTLRILEEGLLRAGLLRGLELRAVELITLGRSV